MRVLSWTQATRIIAGLLALGVLTAAMGGAAGRLQPTLCIGGADATFSRAADSSATAGPPGRLSAPPLQAQGWRAKDFVIIGAAAGFVLLLGAGAWVVRRRGGGWRED